MKIVIQILLILLIILVFAVFQIGSVFKFALLNSNFWIMSFTRNNVYTSLSKVIKNSFELQVTKDGFDKNEARVLTDLITPENTKDFVNNNLINLLDFTNGKSAELSVYIPISRTPKDILPKSISTLNNEMTLEQISEKFNVTGLDKLPLKELNSVGRVLGYLVLVSGLLLVIMFVLLILLTESGTRFVAAGVSLIMSGTISIIFGLGLIRVSNVFKSQVAMQNNLNNEVAKVILPNLLSDLNMIFLISGIGIVFFGLLISFLKKPAV